MKLFARVALPVIALSLISPLAHGEEDLFNETATTQIENPEVVLAAPSYALKATTTGGKTSIKVTTNLPNTTLTAIASKSGVKAKLTFRFKTNAKGIAIVSSRVNLRGYVFVLYNGAAKVSQISVANK